MPEGLLYEGVSEEPLYFSGGSAAQSSVYHAFDELLGIQHQPASGKSGYIHCTGGFRIIFWGWRLHIF